MSNVIKFPNSEAKHMLIEAGTISGPPDHPYLGQLRYFVSVVDVDGAPLGVWDGPAHIDALDEARLWDMPIVDHAANAAGGEA